MTLVKCGHCGAERELSYDQIKTVHLEKRTCPTCGIGTERVAIQETRFQPLAEHIKTTPRSVTVTTQIPVAPAPEPEEQKDDEDTGIQVGPGGSVTRRRRPASR